MENYKVKWWNFLNLCFGNSDSDGKFEVFDPWKQSSIIMLSFVTICEITWKMFNFIWTKVYLKAIQKSTGIKKETKKNISSY